MPWDKLLSFGPSVATIAILIWGVVKMGPLWKDVKMRELEIRNVEANVKQQEVSMLTKLADTLAGFAGLLEKVAVDHRRASEEMAILQRVNSDQADQLTREVRLLSSRMERLERERVERANVNLESSGSGTGAD